MPSGKLLHFSSVVSFGSICSSSSSVFSSKDDLIISSKLLFVNIFWHSSTPLLQHSNQWSRLTSICCLNDCPNISIDHWKVIRIIDRLPVPVLPAISDCLWFQFTHRYCNVRYRISDVEQFLALCDFKIKIWIDGYSNHLKHLVRVWSLDRSTGKAAEETPPELFHPRCRRFAG